MIEKNQRKTDKRLKLYIVKLMLNKNGKRTKYSLQNLDLQKQAQKINFAAIMTIKKMTEDRINAILYRQKTNCRI